MGCMCVAALTVVWWRGGRVHISFCVLFTVDSDCTTQTAITPYLHAGATAGSAKPQTHHWYMSVQLAAISFGR